MAIRPILFSYHVPDDKLLVVVKLEFLFGEIKNLCFRQQSSENYVYLNVNKLIIVTMSTERKLSNSLLLVVLLALSAYNLYSVITLKEEVASLKGETVQSEETVTPEQPSMEVIADKVIVPTAKARVEDRYVEYELVLPVGEFTEEGTVVINVAVDYFGAVTSTSVKSSTIADEDVQYACREAALKTRFSHNIHAGHDSRARGTITYTFLAQ